MPSFREVNKPFFILDDNNRKYKVNAVEVSKAGKCVNCIWGKSNLTGFTRYFDCLSSNPNCTSNTRPDGKNVYYTYC